MKRVNTVVCLGLLVLTWGMVASSARAEDIKNQAAWEKLKQLSAGQEIQVVQNGAQSTTGHLRSVTDEAIVVITATGEQTLARLS